MSSSINGIIGSLGSSGDGNLIIPIPGNSGQVQQSVRLFGI